MNGYKSIYYKGQGDIGNLFFSVNSDYAKQGNATKNRINYTTGGAPLVGRSYTAPNSEYRFGFNKGSEKDDEISGAGNHFTTLFREGDTRLLIWWGVDPKAKEQPWQSPYSYMDGNPIKNNDPNGDIVPVTMFVGGVIGFGVGLYDLAGTYGGLGNAVTALYNGDNKARAHLAVTTVTGVALGSGVGVLGAIGIAGTADVIDQHIQNDGKINPIQTVTAMTFAGLGSVGGKIISKAVLKPVTQEASVLNPFVEKTVFPANNPIRVAITEAANGATNSVAEKITNYVQNKPNTSQPATTTTKKPSSWSTSLPPSTAKSSSPTPVKGKKPVSLPSQ